MKDKILFYSWKAIVANSKSLEDIVKIVDILTYNRIPKNSRDRYKHLYAKDYSGTSFILRPKRFLELEASIDDKVSALYLASKRDYTNYKFFNNRGLKLDLVKEDINIVKSNKLIQIENNTIYFTFEDKE